MQSHLEANIEGRLGLLHDEALAGNIDTKRLKKVYKLDIPQIGALGIAETKYLSSVVLGIMALKGS